MKSKKIIFISVFSIFFVVIVMFSIAYSNEEIRSAITDKFLIKRLTKEAELIILGDVTDTHTEWCEDQSFARICTNLRVEVLAYFKGERNKHYVTVTQPGGAIEINGQVHTEYTNPPTPQLNVGETYILFLKKIRVNDTEYEIIGIYKGQFKVSNGLVKGKYPLGDFVSSIVKNIW